MVAVKNKLNESKVPRHYRSQESEELVSQGTRNRELKNSGLSLGSPRQVEDLLSSSTGCLCISDYPDVQYNHPEEPARCFHLSVTSSKSHLLQNSIVPSKQKVSNQRVP